MLSLVSPRLQQNGCTLEMKSKPKKLVIIMVDVFQDVTQIISCRVLAQSWNMCYAKFGTNMLIVQGQAHSMIKWCSPLLTYKIPWVAHSNDFSKKITRRWFVMNIQSSKLIVGNASTWLAIISHLVCYTNLKIANQSEDLSFLKRSHTFYWTHNGVYNLSTQSNLIVA
jgi:hypothetical protein